jgi:hypothetical protein
MLRKETVAPGTLELLTNLMLDNRLQDFFLVGGTALSLQIGHRISIDIDLFSTNNFSEQELLIYLETHKEWRLNYLQKSTIKGQINNVQVDLIAHTYPLVNSLIVIDNIRMASLEDIAAMKLNAIAGTGTRLKDFVDIAALSAYCTLNDMLNAYQKKYQTRNPFLPLKALAYYNDINHNEPLHLIAGKYKWKAIEQRIGEMINNRSSLFPELFTNIPGKKQ